MEKIKKPVLAALFLASISLCSCGKANEAVTLDSYGGQVEVGSNSAKILQLTDIHWTLTTDVDVEKRLIAKVIEEADPDFIIVTGDTFFIANENLVNTFFSFMESTQKPYGLLWGNHDYEGTYSRDWLNKKAGEGKHSYFKNPSDNVSGDSNYFVDITNNGKAFFRLYALDSHSSAVDGISAKYDYIYEDAVKWFEDEAEAGKASNSGVYLPSLAFFHIPLWEWAYAYADPATKNGVIGEVKEKATNSGVSGLSSYGPQPFWMGYKDSGFFNSGTSHGVKGFFTGHDHSNDWIAKYKGAYIGYGVKTGKGCYYTTSSKGYDMTGGSLYTVDNLGNIAIKQIFVDTDTLEVNSEVASNE